MTTELSECAAPPVAPTEPKTNTLHGVSWDDPYAWLRDREDPRVRAYLEAENDFAEAAMAPTEALQEQLNAEMLSYINENELSAPYRRGDYWYYMREEEGKSYPIHCRKKGSLDAPEEVILDENVLAEGKNYFARAVIEPSPDGKLLAYSTDEVGNERYTLRVLDLSTGELLATKIEDTYYSIAWANDSKTLFTTRIDAANRPHQLLRHRLGSPDVEVVHQEDDDRFFVSVFRARSGGAIIATIDSKLTSEVWFADADAPDKFTTLAERQQGVELRVDHRLGPNGGSFFVVTNIDDAVNFRMFEVQAANVARDQWNEVMPTRDDVTIVRPFVFKDHVAVWSRGDGLSQIEVRNHATGETQRVRFPEDGYSIWANANFVYDTTLFRFSYSSLITPWSVYDVDLATLDLELVQQRDVPNYDASKYETTRITTRTYDGTHVPITLVYKKGARDAGPAPLLLKGYGSYGASYDPSFSATNLPLLDRGVILALAHIRGGGENGRAWHQAGKFLNKKNTFTDFVAAGAHLVAMDYTKPHLLAASGRSAGGLLMGAVANMRPDLFKVIVAGVPFVDVLNTMLDPTIPLTVTEWEEWGNPQEKEYFDYIKSYAPYENIEAMKYPEMLVTAGLNDPRVGYWEPAKWVARLRATATPGSTLLLKTNMGAGHGGASGRYDYLKELAFEAAFILRHLGVVEIESSCK